MLKHIYKTILLIAVFIASLVYFSRDIKEVVFHIDNTIQMSEATFPVVTLETEDCQMNLLHGYAGSMQSNHIRDSITPLDATQNILVYIKEHGSTVKKVNYELRDTFDNSLLESGSYSALEKNANKKIAKIKISTTLEHGKEYALTITTVTAESKKINFYTRVVRNPSYHLKDKLEYVSLIHKTLFEKEKMDLVSSYFEPSRNADTSSLHYVNINSSLDAISFGALQPELITEVIPTVKEISGDIASIEMQYYIKGTTPDGIETYVVKEFYRVKYTATRMYLLNYERTMETIFDASLMQLKQGEIKLGIAGEDAAQLYVGEGGTNLCFVRNGELWYYEVDMNEVVRVFSFAQEHSDYVRDRYDQYDIKVLNMTVEGKIDFVVYGYMNRGNYEGRVGILLYRYDPTEYRIEELVYIPVSEPYQMLKESMGTFSYLTYNDVYYFMLNQTIYSYNIITKSLTTLAEEIGDRNYVFSKEKRYIAWENNEENIVRSITILELETQVRRTIDVEQGDTIRLLGMIDGNMICGKANINDIYTKIDGERIVPCYEVFIIDLTKQIKKTYQKEDYYVTAAEVKDNVIHLSRVIRVEDSFEETSKDHILNQMESKNETVTIASKWNEQTFTERYITIKNNSNTTVAPKVYTTSTTIIADETVLRLETSPLSECYYVYAYGSLQGRYESAGEAIRIANDLVGVVMNQNEQLVWERGTRNSKVMLEVTPVYAEDGVSSYDACLKMLGQFVKKDRNRLSQAFASSTLKEASETLHATVIQMTGAHLEDVLYYINKGWPVIAAKSQKDTMLIIGYDTTSITVIDPKDKVTTKIPMKQAETLFEEMGNVYLTIIE